MRINCSKCGRRFNPSVAWSEAVTACLKINCVSLHAFRLVCVSCVARQQAKKKETAK